MKKIFLFVMSTIFLALPLTISAFAENESEVAAFSSPSFSFNIKNAFSAFTMSKSAIIVAVISFILIFLFLAYRKKLVKKINDSSSGKMLNAFIIFFAVNGIACFALALATDGATWSHMMHTGINDTGGINQFEDFLFSARNAGSEYFYKSSAKTSPFGLLLFYVIAQFMPTNVILSTDPKTYIQMVKNQTCVLLYFFFVIICLIFIYRMSRHVLRKNGCTIKDELVAFLMIVSFPTMYCIELGNIAGLSYALVLFFILFYNSEKKLYRNLSIAALSVSAAITPYTLVFALLMLKKGKKSELFRFIRTIVYFLIMFILPAFFTGFWNMKNYVKTFISIPSDSFSVGNTSIANLLIFFGISNQFVLYAFTAVVEIIAIICIFMLPKMWQKTAAIAYVILNVFSVSGEVTLIFLFIPFIMLLSEKEPHKPIDWMYLLSFTLVITPFAEWYYYDKVYFTPLLRQFNLPYIEAANNLITLTAVQFMFVLLISQTISALKKRKQKQPVLVAEEKENPEQPDIQSEQN